MAVHTSKDLQGFASAGNLYDLKPWVRTIIRADGGGDLDEPDALNVIHGLAYDTDEFNSPARPVLVTAKTATASGSNQIFVSADHGFTWRQWYLDLGGTDNISGIVPAAGLNNFNNGEAIVGLNSTVVGIANLISAHTAPSISSLLHEPGNGFPVINGGSSGGLRVCLDYINNRWYVGGVSGTGVCRMVWRTASTNITTAGSWVDPGNIGTDTNPGIVNHLTFGKSAAGYAIVASVATAGKYCWTNAASPSLPTIVDLTGSTSMNFRKIVYNRYWEQYLAVDTVRGGTTSAVMRFPPSSVGSTNAADYEFITSYNAPASGMQVNSATITVNEAGGAGAIGPWCYFQASAGRVLATPDMGNSWFVISSASMLSNTTLLPSFGVSQADGCIVMSYWDLSNELFYSVRSGSLAAITPFAIR